MGNYDRSLAKVLMMAGIFRMDLGRWPRSAVELEAFAGEKGWNLDLLAFFTLTFQTDEWSCLVVEASRLSEGDWLQRERIDMEPYFFEAGKNMPLRIKSRGLPPKKAEIRLFCKAS